MYKLKSVGAGLLLASMVTGTAGAQTVSPIASRDVVGQWTLRITPAERRGFRITVEAEDGGRPDLSLSITQRTGGAIACVVGGDPAECRIDKGDLVITSVRDAGAAMTFTLTDRARGGFSGSARIRARLLPFGTANVGTVNMVRR